MFSRFHKLAIGFAMLAGVGLTSAAEAQTFTYTTKGCFGCATPTTNTATLNTPGGSPALTYTSSLAGLPTTVTASNGFLAIGGPLVNFGSFTVLPVSDVLIAQPFTLGITFTAPAGVSSGQTFSAAITGSVTAVSGGYAVDFDNSPKTFTYTGGSFTLVVNDLSIFAGAANNISGTIVAVPGPIAGAGIPVAVVGLVGFLHFRRRKSALSA